MEELQHARTKDIKTLVRCEVFKRCSSSLMIVGISLKQFNQNIRIPYCLL
jgi:hypothetical protein